MLEIIVALLKLAITLVVCGVVIYLMLQWLFEIIDDLFK